MRPDIAAMLADDARQCSQPLSSSHRSVHRVPRANGRVLIVERLIPDDPADAVDVLLSDINMLVLTGGMERTNAQYAALLTQAGLAPGRVQPVTAPYGVVEGTA